MTLINARSDLEARDHAGRNPLHIALENVNSMKSFKTLVEAKANISSKDLFRNTILHYAVLCGDMEAVEILLNVGADINAKGEFNKTPLEIAFYRGKDNEIYKKLAAVKLKESKARS